MTGPPEEQLILTAGQVAEMVTHAWAEHPNEACGILGGRDGRAEKVYPLPNTERSSVRYLAEPQAQLEAMLEIEERGWKIVAIYHSHPHSPAYPSFTDVEMACYPESLYLIISLAEREKPVLRAFRIHIENESEGETETEVEIGQIEEVKVRVEE
ncbi:MAG: hypothetical protein DRI48_00965 [Chloroflexi bacterium]|nr:MAG: hypothetical protein DRI48_00965 [Chloroflexota bacterium]